MTDTNILIIGSSIVALILAVFAFTRKKEPSPVGASTPSGGEYPIPEDVLSDEPSETTDESVKSPILKLNPKGDPRKVALLFGINRCDPMVYNGDSLTLRGCVNDSKSFYNYLLKKAGYGKVYYNADEDCSIANFLRVWKSATKDLKDGDTLLLQMSRHGMSLDQNLLDNDQEHNTGTYKGDQAAVMYDGVIVDDCFWRLFMDLPKIKLIYVNDSCHSGTQYKVANILDPNNPNKYRRSRGVSKDYLPKKDKVLDLAQLEKAFGKPSNKDQKFDLISISGSQDHETSADAYIGGKYQGAMTYCLLSSLYTYPKKTLREIGDIMVQQLKANGFDQNPRIAVEGNQDLLDQPLF